MNSERATLTPSPPWGRGQGRGEALHRQWLNDLCVELLTNQLHSAIIRRTPGAVLSLYDQFQTYTQFIRTLMPRLGAMARHLMCE